MPVARRSAVRWIAFALLAALCLTGAPAAAQPPAPTPPAASAPTATSAPTAVPTPTPTLTVAPTATAAPVTATAPALPVPTPQPTPVAKIEELFIDLLFGNDRAAAMNELVRRLGWLAVPLVILLIILPFVWKPIGERIQERIKEGLKNKDILRQTKTNQQKDLAELQKATKDYCENLCKELASTEVIPIPNAYAMTDTRNYVPLRVVRPGATTDEAVFAALGAKRQPRGLLLVGDAGSGKSHTLRYTAFTLAELWPSLPQGVAAPLGLQADVSLLPIYVRMQDLPRCRQVYEREGKAPMLLEMIDYHLQHLLNGKYASSIKNFVSLHVAANKERCLFLFDGLDEIDDARQRAELQNEIIRLQREKPHHIYVVATRPLADQILAGAGFAERRLSPLQPDQMERILFYWYRAEYGSSPTASDEARASQQAASLLATLRDDPDFAPMTVNPLFLTAMVRMATTAVGLPVARVRKFKLMTNLLLDWCRNRMGVDEQIDRYKVLSELGRLAACMLLTGQDTLTLDAYVKGACVEHLPSPSADAPRYEVSELERLFRSVVHHTGLLDQEDNRYRFSFGFRDYFAARFFAEQTNVERRFRKRGGERDWHIPIILTTGYWTHISFEFERVTTLVTALLNSGPDWSLLAAEALCEALADGMVPDLNRLRRATVQRLHSLKDQPQYTERARRLLERLELPKPEVV